MNNKNNINNNVINNTKEKTIMMNRTRLKGSIAIDNRENNILILITIYIFVQHLIQALTCNVYSMRWTPRIMFKDAHMIFRTNERIPGAVTGSSRTFWTVQQHTPIGGVPQKHKTQQNAPIYLVILLLLLSCEQRSYQIQDLVPHDHFQCHCWAALHLSQ